jgi:hypothetical protein
MNAWSDDEASEYAPRLRLLEPRAELAWPERGEGSPYVEDWADGLGGRMVLKRFDRPIVVLEGCWCLSYSVHDDQRGLGGHIRLLGGHILPWNYSR